jgi:RNA polymerase sigma factor (sigma-70 family)
MFPRRRTDLPELDDALLTRLHDRDADAQRDVERTLAPRLLRIATTRVGPDAAESLVHDAFCDFFFRYVDGLESPRAIPAYLKMMVVRRSMRAEARAAQHEPLEDRASAGDPEGDLDERRAMDRLARCLDRLTVRAREVVKLHFGHDLSLADIGARDARSKQAVHKQLQKALTALRACVEAA